MQKKGSFCVNLNPWDDKKIRSREFFCHPNKHLKLDGKKSGEESFFLVSSPRATAVSSPRATPVSSPRATKNINEKIALFKSNDSISLSWRLVLETKDFDSN